VQSLVGFQRVHLKAGERRQVSLELAPRALSSVDDKGKRSIFAGQYHLSVGPSQPGEATQKSETDFTIQGTVNLPE
jgi:beta-glucosidase